MAAAEFSQSENTIGGEIHCEPCQPKSQQENQTSETIALDQQDAFAIRWSWFGRWRVAGLQFGVTHNGKAQHSGC